MTNGDLHLKTSLLLQSEETKESLNGHFGKLSQQRMMEAPVLDDGSQHSGVWDDNTPYSFSLPPSSVTETFSPPRLLTQALRGVPSGHLARDFKDKYFFPLSICVR